MPKTTGCPRILGTTHIKDTRECSCREPAKELLRASESSLGEIYDRRMVIHFTRYFLPSRMYMPRLWVPTRMPLNV